MEFGNHNNAKLYVISQIIAFLALLLVLQINLLPALLAGLFIFYIVQITTPILSKVGIVPGVGKIITLVVIALIVLASIVLCVVGLNSFLNGDSGGFIALLQKMADIIATAKGHLPPWVQDFLPSDVVDLQAAAATWLREYAAQISKMGRSIGVSIIYILTGLVIGGMIAFSNTHQSICDKPLTKFLTERAKLLNISFGRIVFSQVRISSINTLLTAIFLIIILPLFGIILPFTKIMIAVTFIVGLLPVIGNLMSNAVIVLISLSVSPGTAAVSLSFLIVIHKLEYFLNAHIIGTNIRAKAWEIILAMLIMEAAFGISGVVSAPIYYAYLKDELAARNLI